MMKPLQNPSKVNDNTSLIPNNEFRLPIKIE